MSRKQAECLLAAVIFARSTSLLCAGVTLLGVGFLTLRSSVGFGPGEGLCLLEACLYAVAIILIGKFSRTGDPLVLGMFQIGFLGLFAAVASLLLESPHLPGTAREWGGNSGAGAGVLLLWLYVSAGGPALYHGGAGGTALRGQSAVNGGAQRRLSP